MRFFGITMGDPCGVGPEIILKALKHEPRYANRCIVYGSLPVLEHYNNLLGFGFRFNPVQSAKDVQPGCINVHDPLPVTMAEIPVGQVSTVGGNCAFAAVRAAIDAALRGDIGCVVTAPLNKEALHLAGHNFAGHTEIFAHFCHGSSYAMVLWSETLKTIHVSTHRSLRAACDAVTTARVVEVSKLAHDLLKKTGYAQPRIAVAGLNPHAGENGLFGQEELTQIIPAIALCKGEGMHITGPVPPDTVFLSASRGHYDMVVAMYHDQGHIPLKLLAFDKGVNITVGLDVIRTSVDHGTAFDIAGKLVAAEDSLLMAIDVGEKLLIHGEM